VVHVAPDALQIIVKCNLNTILLLHRVALAEPEFSILEGLLLDFLVLRLNLLHNKLAILKLIRSHCLSHLILNHLNGYYPQWAFSPFDYRARSLELIVMTD
jgi:hypothetical protein